MDSSGLKNPENILSAYSFGVGPISGVSIERSLPPPQVPFPGSRVDLERRDTNAIAAMESEEGSAAYPSTSGTAFIVSLVISNGK